MNLLFRVVFAHGCRSTHHKLAMDSLCHLRTPNAEKWQNLFLKYHEPYLIGAKAPDTKFKDFKNHVLHVRENFWGGAPATASKWYAQTVAALGQQDWKSAVYNAGVLSHYYTDPLMPFHTAQSEAENNIHRAAEWSITKSYDVLRSLLETQVGYPEVSVPQRPDWLEEMVREGAIQSNPSYETLIRNYDFSKGVKDPPAGLDDVSRQLLARLIGHAIVGYARILERAFVEANVEPPMVSVTLQGFLAALKIPVKWVTKKLADAKERTLVEAMYNELQQTGKVERNLPEDDFVVREFHRIEVIYPKHDWQESPVVAPEVEPVEPVVLKIPEPTPEKVQPTRTLKFYLETSNSVGDAPSIGPKTETRLNAQGVRTVADLLAIDSEVLASRLSQRHITPQVIMAWQDQARLVCQIPQLRGHDAQILVACGCRTVAAVANSVATDLLALAEQFIITTEGQRVLRGGSPPDLEEVQNWIAWATQARELKAA